MNSDSETVLRVCLKLTCRAVAAKAEDLKLKTAVSSALPPLFRIDNQNGTIMVAVMPSITLKNLPRDLHRQLKIRARAHHRSLNGEVIATLQRATASGGPIDAEMMLREAREARGQFKRVIATGEIGAWKKRGRL